jgi:hypothetical protein
VTPAQLRDLPWRDYAAMLRVLIDEAEARKRRR